MSSKVDVVSGLKRGSEKIDVLAIASIGFFFVLIGIVFAANPDLITKISDFFRDFELQEVYPGVSFYGPASPVSTHSVVFSAAFQFCFAFAVFQCGILAARFALRESVGRKAGTFSGMLFWFGAAVGVWALMAESIDWFMFLGLLVVLVGLVIAIRCTISFVFWRES